MTFVALVRGVNVGGKNVVRMPDVAALFETLGCMDVRTYLQSGNVIFDAQRRDAARLSRLIEAAFLESLGIEAGVIVRGAAEFRETAFGNPLTRGRGVDESALYATFLRDEPDPGLVAALRLTTAPGERYELHGRDVYVYCPHGYGRTKLNNAAIERALKTPATTRSWKTVLALVDMLK